MGGQVLLSDIADLREVVEVKDFHCSSLVESQRNQRQILNDREENMRALESSVHLIKSKCVELQVDFQVKTEELQRVDMVRDELKKSLSQKDATIQTLELELIASQNSIRKYEKEFQIQLEREEKSSKLHQDLSSEINGLMAQNAELQSMLITSKEEALALKDSLENEMKFMKDEKKKEAATMNDMRREMSKSEKLYREELIEREKLSEALRNELEKRLEELSSEKKESSTLRTENMK